MKKQRQNKFNINQNLPVRLLNRGILILIVLPFIQSSLFAQKWSLNTSVAYSNGKYIYENAVENYYFSLGVNYQDVTAGYSLSLNVPAIIQKSNMNSGSSEMQMISSTNESTVNSGISNVYLYGEYILLQANTFLPQIALKGQLKIPTATTNTLFSSGKFDFGGGIAIRKMYRSFRIFADAGYLVLGDPVQFNYNNPFTYGIGIARYLKHGNSSVSLYYQTYTTVIDGLDSPRQLTLGYFRSISKHLILSLFLSTGFGESSPAYTMSSGLNIRL